MATSAACSTRASRCCSRRSSTRRPIHSDAHDGDTTSPDAAMIAGQYWITPQLWIKGGVGLATCRPTTPTSAYDAGTGGAIMGAVGFELIRRAPSPSISRAASIPGAYNGLHYSDRGDRRRRPQLVLVAAASASTPPAAGALSIFGYSSTRDQGRAVVARGGGVRRPRGARARQSASSRATSRRCARSASSSRSSRCSCSKKVGELVAQESTS